MCKSLLENVAICVTEAWQQVKPTTILCGFQKAKLLPRKPTDPKFSSDSDTEAENSQFFEDPQAYSEENYQLAENMDTGADTTAGSTGVGDTNVNINLIDQYYAGLLN